MRQITFGPTHTNYFDIDDHELIERRLSAHNSDRARRGSTRSGSSQQNSPRGGRSSNFQQRLISTVNEASRSQEVSFFATEDLFRDNIVGTRELAIKKYCKCKLQFDDSRSYASYCHEFCGLLNIRFSDIRFFQGRKEVAMMRTIKKPCEIMVYYNKLTSAQRQLKANSMFENALGPAYNTLLESGLYADLTIVVHEEKFYVHKCILTSRSEKFKVMLTSDSLSAMKEQVQNKMVVTNPQITAQTFRAMLQWIYTGECEMSDNASEVLPLLSLTDEYLLPDLQRVCEDQIVDYMDVATATTILTDPNSVLPETSEKSVREAAKAVFLEEYDRLLEEDPELEEKIYKIRGLISELLTYKKRKVKSIRKRRSSLSIGNDDSQGKKKVRFNISSTIYEDASAMQDDSVSMIEPLSIYSNVSPPGELADESFPQSSISLNQQLSARQAQNTTASQTQQSILDSEQIVPGSGRRGSPRPASAGGWENSRANRHLQVTRSLI